MATGVSKWTSIGSPLVSTINNDSAAEENNFIGPGDVGIPRYECHVWLDGTGVIATKHFNFPIGGLLNININGGVTAAGIPQALNISSGTLTVKMEGSLTGHEDSYIPMPSDGTALGTTSIVALQSANYVYDCNEDGLLPFMRLTFQQGAAQDNTNVPVKITIGVM